MAVSQEKISVYNLADLKNTSDDAIPNYLNSLKLRESHRLTDVRLALGYSAFLLSAACFAWDYKFGFESTKHLTAAAVALYTLLNTALTVWIFYVERGTVYVGTTPDGRATLRVSTSVAKNVPLYNITVDITPAGGKGKTETLVIRRSFTDWFDSAGHFVVAPFQSMLASAIPAIAQLDPKRAAAAREEGDRQAAMAYTPEILDALASASVSAVGSAPESVAATTGADTKGGKRRKA